MSNLKLLVIDDSRLIHALFGTIFAPKRREIDLRFAFHGREAMALLELHGEPDIVFLDVNMGIMSGIEFLTAVAPTKLAERVPIIVVSTEDTDEDVARARDLGARDYVRKPFTPRDIVLALERHVSWPQKVGGA